MVLPGDLGVVRGIVAAIVDILRHRIVDVSDQTLRHREAANSRKKTLGHAVDRIIGLRVAELRHNIPVAKNDAVGGRALLRQRTERRPERAHLVLLEVPRASVGLRVFNRLLKLGGIHAQFSRRFLLPLSRRRIIRGCFLRCDPGRKSRRHQQKSKQGESNRWESVHGRLVSHDSRIRYIPSF